MLVTEIFDESANFDKNLFAEGLMMNRSCVLEARGNLHQRFLVAPCSVAKRASHTANPNCHPCFKILATLRTVNRLEVFPPEPFDYLRIELTRPLTLAGPLRLVEFVA